MTSAKRWLLPDGVEEILPLEASKLEYLRRQLLDLYESWGYQLVITPLIEYLDSLLVGSSQDLDLHTFKITDQLSGRMMGHPCRHNPAGCANRRTLHGQRGASASVLRRQRIAHKATGSACIASTYSSRRRDVRSRRCGL